MKTIAILLKKKLMLAKKKKIIALHMGGITQNKQKCLTFIVVPRGRKNFIRLGRKEEYSTSKN